MLLKLLVAMYFLPIKAQSYLFRILDHKNLHKVWPDLSEEVGQLPPSGAVEKKKVIVF